MDNVPMVVAVKCPI